MKKILHSTRNLLVILFLFLAPILTQDFVEATPVQQVQKPTLIQANHYFSNKQKSVNYNIVSLNKSLPITIIPKNSKLQRISYTNKINLTMNDNKGNYISCQIDDNYQLCVLEKFTSDAISLIIQCQSLPCEFSWIVLQTPIQKIDTKNVQMTSLKELYEIQQSQQNKHLTIKVTCASMQLQKGFHQQLQFYADRQNYHKLKTQGITYFLFSNPPTSFKQYFFVKFDQKYSLCAKIEIFNQQTQVEPSSQKSVTDFLLGTTSVTYSIKNHSKDMRIDMGIHLFSQTQDVSGQISIKVNGLIGGLTETVRKMSLKAKTKKYIDFSFIINNISTDYTNLQLVLESTKIDTIIKFHLVSGQPHQVQKGQYSFFSLKKGQKIKYQIVEEKQANKGQKIFVFASDTKKVKLSKKECDSKSGCEFDLEASQAIDGSIYLGQQKKQNTEQVVKFDIDKSFTKRVRQDTTIYLVKQVQQKKSYQVVVNTHNVILYSASQQKCPQMPSQKCHQKVGNSHHPFIYSSQKKQKLVIAVHALDQTEFTVTIIEQNGEYPQLKDGIPFIYLMDDAEQDIVFRFNLDEKDDLTFNLVSPLNQLVLYVMQGDKLPKNYQDKLQLYTVDGYIYFQKQRIKSNKFIVVVRKLDPSKAQFVHFTIIASTKNANIKLQAGVTHHQKLVANQHQDFVLQFDPAKKYVISFYVHNSVGKIINISLDLSKNDTYDQKSKQNEFFINQEVDQIDISEQGKKVCQTQGSKSCQVFLRLQNKMSRDVNMQLTLLTTNSIVELHDGIWQYFPEQLTSTTTNFYFFPKHFTNPISILYQSNNPDLRILYSLSKMDQQTIDPSLWSFPSIQRQQNQRQSLNLGVKQVKHINIGKQALKSCLPNCVLLLTLAKSNKVKGQFSEISRNKQFGILVSNNIIDIPERTKVEVTLQKGQQKFMKMSMKNVFEHSTLTSYTYTSLGSNSIYANACSQKNFRMPTQEQFDFSFGILQTQLRAQTIKKKFKENEIQEEESPYLCLVAVSDQNTKFSIEYTSEQEIISLLRLDEYKTVSVEKGQAKYFQVQGSVEHTVKIIRNKGFPFIQYKKCTGKDVSYEQCLQELQQDSEDSEKYQIIEKVKRYQYQPCEKCIVYIKISGEQNAEVDIHLQSKYTEMTLQQKRIVTDYLQVNQQNRYEVTALTNEATYINVNVMDGSVRCKVSDLGAINIEKQTQLKQKVLHFAITPNQLQQAKANLGAKKFDNPLDSMFSGFGLENLFATLHISIVSIDPEKGASYTVQYSSGERQSYLQDGIVYKYNLQGNSPKSPAKFYYQNYDQNNHVYIFLGTLKSSQLSKLQINIYEMQSQDETDDDDRKSINSKIPQLRKKTVKPTVLYPLPTAKFYSIQVFNPTAAQIQLSIGVNHQQVLFLPYETDYPFPLANGENINFIVDVQNKGYLLLTLKKCDQSTAEVSYTFDYQGFKVGQYQYTTTLNYQPKFEYLIKTKQAGPLYINIKRSEPQGLSYDLEFVNSVFSLNARFSEEKMKTSDFLKPGNKGLMKYEILNDNKVRIQFTEITCPSKSQFCSQKFQYYLVASDKMVDVYSQSVCPSTYFADVQNAQKHTVLPLRKILQKPNSQHKITFEYQFQKNNAISYVAIKAIYKNKEDQSVQVYYRPIEVATFWGQIQKASTKHLSKIKIVAGVIFAFCIFIVCLRRQTRKGYHSLQQQE